MYATMDVEVSKQRREEMLRDAELGRLERATRTDRGKPTASRWASTVAWELARFAGLLRKLLRPPTSAG